MERFQNTRQLDWDWWATLWPAPGETLRRLGLGTDDDLLEVGCGNGYFTLPAAVDVALIANTFHSIEEPPSFLEAVTAALAENGRFIVVNWRDLPKETTTAAGTHRGPPADLRLSPDGTRRIVQEAVDVRLAEQVDTPPYHYGLVFER